MERLQKFMSRHGIASRRACEEIIAAGRVRVNGKVISTPGVTVDPARDKVVVDGRRLGEPEKKIYIMINKPRGYISTAQDPRGRKKVTDLLENIKERVYPVGRLDYDSEGLLIMTNDGEFAQKLTHPSHEVPKTYRVRLKGLPSDDDLDKIATGVMLDDKMTAPAKLAFIEEREGNALLEITISEGRNRQVRRMFETINFEVIRLKRVKIGSLTLGNLKSGENRPLRETEVTVLLKMAGIKRSPPKRISNLPKRG
ncbi:MAG: pseudouridine synthase [Desulfocucumaceae bacterium]